MKMDMDMDFDFDFKNEKKETNAVVEENTVNEEVNITTVDNSQRKISNTVGRQVLVNDSVTNNENETINDNVQKINNKETTDMDVEQGGGLALDIKTGFIILLVSLYFIKRK